MEEISSGGYAVEYVCRIIDETEGNESVPESAQTANLNLTGKNTSKTSGKKEAETAKKSKTSEYMNAGLRVLMPAINGFTNGVAGQIFEKGGQIARLIQSIAVGSAGGALGAVASLGAWGVGEIVRSILNERQENDTLAESIDELNFSRQMAGLKKFGYTRTGITGKLNFSEER